MHDETDCDCAAARHQRRRERRRELRQLHTEPEDVARGAERLVAALGRRAAGDPDALPMLVSLTRQADQALHAAVTAGIDKGWWSYGDVGRALGVSRQAAQKRFSKAAQSRAENVQEDVA